MKDYSLLTNSTYLWILQHPGEKINYSKISREIGLTRQTVAKEYKQLNGMFDNIYSIVDFHNEECDRIKRAIAILIDLEGEYLTNQEIAKMLHLNKNTIGAARVYNYISGKVYDTKGMAVYCVKHNGNIIYIGSTLNFRNRKMQHLHGIKQNCYDDLYLYKYCNDNNISYTDVDICVMYDKFDSKDEMLQMEASLIKAVAPICNINFV